MPGSCLLQSGVYSRNHWRSNIHDVIMASSRTSRWVIRMQMVGGCMATGSCASTAHNSEVVNSPMSVWCRVVRYGAGEMVRMITTSQRLRTSRNAMRYWTQHAVKLLSQRRYHDRRFCGATSQKLAHNAIAVACHSSANGFAETATPPWSVHNCSTHSGVASYGALGHVPPDFQQFHF